MWPDRVTRYMSERMTAFSQLESDIGRPEALQIRVKHALHELGLVTIPFAELQ